MLEVFRMADDVLCRYPGYTDLITVPGLINLDFCRRLHHHEGRR